MFAEQGIELLANVFDGPKLPPSPRLDHGAGTMKQFHLMPCERVQNRKGGRNRHRVSGGPVSHGILVAELQPFGQHAGSGQTC